MGHPYLFKEIDSLYPRFRFVKKNGYIEHIESMPCVGRDTNEVMLDHQGT